MTGYEREFAKLAEKPGRERGVNPYHIRTVLIMVVTLLSAYVASIYNSDLYAISAGIAALVLIAQHIAILIFKNEEEEGEL